jgi:hypothetical protein
MKYKGEIINGTIATYPTKRHSFNLDNTDAYIKILNPNLSSDFDTGYFNDITKSDTPYTFSKPKVEEVYDKYAKAHFKEMDRREYEDRRYAKITEGFDNSDRLGPAFENLYEKGTETEILEQLKDIIDAPVKETQTEDIIVIDTPRLPRKSDDFINDEERDEYIKRKTQQSAKKMKKKMDEFVDAPEFIPETPAPTKRGRPSQFPTPPNSQPMDPSRKNP